MFRAWTLFKYRKYSKIYPCVQVQLTEVCMVLSHYVTASALLCPKNWQKPTRIRTQQYLNNRAGTVRPSFVQWIFQVKFNIFKIQMKQCLQFNTSYLKQGCCRIPLQALCQFIHLIQEENRIVHPHSLQPVDDPARHAAHIGAPGKEWGWGNSLVTQRAGPATSKMSQMKLQAKQKKKDHCNK